MRVVSQYQGARGTTTDQTIRETKEILKKNKLIKKGDLVMLPFWIKRTTPFCSITSS